MQWYSVGIMLKALTIHFNNAAKSKNVFVNYSVSVIIYIRIIITDLYFLPLYVPSTKIILIRLSYG